MKINFKNSLKILLFTVFIGQAAVVAQNKTILQLADEYSIALKKYQQQKSQASVENVLHKGKAVNKKIEDIESLSAANYALLEKKMKGFVINREEVLFIEPDLKFYAQLLKTHGTKADAAFINLMRQIRDGNVWAKYIEMQTDVTGCIIYGNGVLTTLYGKTLQFKKIYPKVYMTDVNEEIEKILEEFLEGTCACGSRKSVLKEFQLFIKTFPNDKNTPRIKKRLANIAKNKEFRFNCQSG